MWAPTDLDIGSYEVVPRLVSDALSALFPYANPQSASFAVTDEERETTLHCYNTVAEAADGENQDRVSDGGTIDGGLSVAAAVGAIRADAESVTSRLRVATVVPDSEDRQGAQAEALMQGFFIYDLDQTAVTFRYRVTSVALLGRKSSTLSRVWMCTSACRTTRVLNRRMGASVGATRALHYVTTPSGVAVFSRTTRAGISTSSFPCLRETRRYTSNPSSASTAATAPAAASRCRFHRDCSKASLRPSYSYLISNALSND